MAIPFQVRLFTPGTTVNSNSGFFLYIGDFYCREILFRLLVYGTVACIIFPDRATITMILDVTKGD